MSAIPTVRDNGTQVVGARATGIQAGRASAPLHEVARKPVGYGLPCSKCRTYYPADLKACPICKSTERVTVTAVKVPVPVNPAEELPDPAVLEEERERFLREFKEQLSTLETSGSAFPRCLNEENHPGEFVSAAVCQSCYEQLQERVDILEAALQMDLKEAAQIIYDAVWADPSDPSKTYENAASALLTELRKRSGVPQTFALLRPAIAE
ncbi:MAG TPA: hypothetical protein VEI26_08250 [Terriglobales bacterium]|nr:hypothetical protein [Terriglobales bacterium]